MGDCTSKPESQGHINCAATEPNQSVQSNIPGANVKSNLDSAKVKSKLDLPEQQLYLEEPKSHASIRSKAEQGQVTQENERKLTFSGQVTQPNERKLTLSGQVTQPNERRLTLSSATKEGYLTKLGRLRKNWKKRWFALYKSELVYYKTRERMALLRIVYLSDVIDVLSDDSQGKENCFMVITSYRTFFMYASSAEDAEEWIELLREKMSKVTRGKLTKRIHSSRRKTTVKSAPLTLRKIQKELTEVVDWFPLGVQLGLKVSKLEHFRMDYPNDAQLCKIKVLDWWLQNAKDRSWETLAEALETMEYEVIAANLRRKLHEGTL